MRWFGFIILALTAVALQVSAVAAIRVELGLWGLSLGVDLVAILAVLVALRVRQGSDALLGAWGLGLLIDLSVIASPIGLYALTFTLAAGMIVQVRDAVFSDNPLTQAGMAFTFCLVAHGLARLFVNLYVRREAGLFSRELVQVLLVAACTAFVGPIVLALMRRLDWLIVVRPSRQRR